MPPPILRLLLLVGLGFFLGLAFEDFNARAELKRPGGIRTFPLLALTGALLYRLDPVHFILLGTGLLVLGLWLACYYWQNLRDSDPHDIPDVSLMVPLCNVIALLLGPVALAEPPWVAVGVTVTAVLFLTAREGLHGFARRIELAEIVNAGRFLLLTGFALPLLPDHPVTDLTSITPHQMWLAVVAVCTVSYASYLLQRYVAPADADLLTALLGGLYSSTATTVVLARRARAEQAATRQTGTGIILATAVMYLRLLIITAVFSQPLARGLAPPVLGLCAIGLVCAAGWQWLGRRNASASTATAPPANPLELGTAAVFAVLFVAVSIASSWATRLYGAAGVYVLAAIVGVSDIDPFVLSLAQNGAGSVSTHTGAIAILLAASSNNVLKAVYAFGYSGPARLVGPALLLLLLAAAGGVAAFALA